MKWFSGSVAEAIQIAQSQKNGFVAYVEGTCEKSKMMFSVFNEKTVSEILEKNAFVCVKFEANSIGHKQLTEIYKSIPVPSLFFISYNGIPLNIVEGNIYDNASEMKSAILEAAEDSARKNSGMEPIKTVKGEDIIQERRRQVEELINTKRRDITLKKLKGQTEEENNKKMEAGESDEGKTKKEIELKKLIEEREKEKKAEAMARQEVLDQIAQDRADRIKRMQMNEIKPSTSAKSSPAANDVQEKPKPTSSSTNARIQFRLPTGESSSKVFPNATTLKEIRSYIDSNLGLTGRNYQLTTTFPRRVFTAADNESSLQDLNLTPSAVLLILTKTGAVNPHRKSWFSMTIDVIYSYVETLKSTMDRLWVRVFGPSAPTSQPAQSTPPPSQPSQAPSSSTYTKKTNNIVSLKDLRDGNDENNTWNGNSTQQM